MKKFAFLPLITMMAIVGAYHAAGPLIAPKNDGAVAQIKNVAPLSSFKENAVLPSKKAMPNLETAPFFIMDEPEEEPEIKQSRCCDDIPLTYEEQDWLQTACEEFGVPYALALGLIEKETMFQNLVGDSGASTGYMQIQQKWHYNRMERLGVTNLMEPSGNFRVGCDLLAELYGKYNDWSLALTVYNFGHDPGYISDYAKEVMKNYARWQEILDNYIYERMNHHEEVF